METLKLLFCLQISGANLTNLNASDSLQALLMTARLADSGVTAATVGGSTAIPIITFDAKGRITGTTTPNIVLE